MLNTIRDSAVEISYRANELKTYLVFAPVVSLVIQKINLAHITPLLPDPKSSAKLQPPTENRYSERFKAICKWHLRGSIVQTLAFVVAMKVLAAPILGVFALLSAYELADTAYKSLRKVTTFEFEGGVVRKANTSSALNIF